MKMKKCNSKYLLHEAMLFVMYELDPNNKGMTSKEICKEIVKRDLYRRKVDGMPVKESQISARANTRIKIFDKDFSQSRVLIKRKERFN